MPRSRLVGLLFSAWDDFDRVLVGLSPQEAVTSGDGGSSFAWTAAHVANQVDAWINVRFQGTTPHPLIGEARFRFGGSGTADDWASVQAGVREVRGKARDYLEPMGEPGLDLTIPYDGSILHLRTGGLHLGYAIMRACAHHYFHIGEIAAKRVAAGHNVGDYPGPLHQCLTSP